MKIPKLPLFLLLILMGFALALGVYKLRNAKVAPATENNFPEYDTRVSCDTGSETNKITLDFKKCVPCQKSVAGSFGATKFVMHPRKETNIETGQNKIFCQLNYGVDTLNPANMNTLATECVIPLDTKDTTFEVKDFGIDFEKIKNFCKPTSSL